MKTIFITGGHYTPAKAVIDVLLANSNWKIFYLGRKYPMEDDKAVSLEFTELSGNKKISFLALTTGRLQRKFFVNLFQSVKSLAKVAVGFLQSFYFLAKYRPGLVLSFGGYMAVPVVFWAKIFGIPVITHEQTVVSGLSNEIISRLADRILVSWPESVGRFPANKAILTGNPLRQAILSAKKTLSKRKRPLIYVTGGNQGSHVINEAVRKALPELLHDYDLVHQTGDSQKYRDFEVLNNTRDNLAGNIRKYYRIYKFLGETETAEMLSGADLVVSRSGANTITELMYLGTPAILVPIPWSYGNEQRQNAEKLEKIGMAVIIPQEELTGERLLSEIKKALLNLNSLTEAAGQARNEIIPDAPLRIVKEIERLAK